MRRCDHFVPHALLCRRVESESIFRSERDAAGPGPIADRSDAPGAVGMRWGEGLGERRWPFLWSLLVGVGVGLRHAAQPVVLLSPKEVTIERDKEKTVSCVVNKFYPDSIVIQWEKNAKHSPDKSVPAEDICTGSSVENEDGTFNITSKLKLQPSLQDDGNIYNCIVKHKSFSMEPVFSIILTVTELQGNYTWIAGLIAAMAVVFPPTVMAFVGNEKLKNLEENHLQFLFSDFRPKPLKIKFFLIQPNKEKQAIYSWNTKAASDPEQGDEHLALLKKQKMFHFIPVLSQKKRHIFEASCKLSITPDVKQLQSFDISLEIIHQAFPHGISVKTQSFEVVAHPVLDRIQCSTDEPRPDESLTLSCRIYAYFPQAIETCWWKDDEPIPLPASVTDPIKTSDGLFFCTTNLQFFPQAEDIGKRFFCKARLKGFQQFRESAWELNTLVFIPKVSHIECEPSEPEFGKPITLSCVVRDFYPPECDICWKKGLKELTYATVKTGDPEQAPASNLYHRKSQVSFIPRPEDHAEEIFVEIKHCNRTIQNKYSLMLKGFPKVADIDPDPSIIEYGKNLCLSCEVMDFDPGEINIQWLDGENVIRNGVDTKGPTMGSNGFFSLTSSYRLVPTVFYYNKSISFKVSHKKLAEPITKSVYLNLPAKPPVLSEIKAIPRQTQGDKKVTLEISISDFAPWDIRVTWYKDWKKLTDYTDPNNFRIGENKLCQLASQIMVDLKQKDIGKIIRCEVHHPATKKFQEKSFILKDFSDSIEQISPSFVNHNHIEPSRSSMSVSEELINSMKIECVTSSPKAGEKVSLRCFVPGKGADGAIVFWSKGLYPVDEEIRNTNCEDGTGFISYVTIKTEKGEQECGIRCEVCVDEETLEDSYTLKLS
ncbi:hypothetical protein lerEdw1_005299 [Lerista edwardsae]|nr:hypothetical protein lerEdw1_005299 [Lerista edwardsae]